MHPLVLLGVGLSRLILAKHREMKINVATGWPTVANFAAQRLAVCDMAIMAAYPSEMTVNGMPLSAASSMALHSPVAGSRETDDDVAALRDLRAQLRKLEVDIAIRIRDHDVGIGEPLLGQLHDALLTSSSSAARQELPRYRSL